MTRPRWRFALRAVEDQRRPRAVSRMRYCVWRTRSRSWVAITTQVPAGVDVAQQLEDAAGGPLVEVAGRLVGQEDRRVVHQRARDAPPAAARRRRARAGRRAPRDASPTCVRTRMHPRRDRVAAARPSPRARTPRSPRRCGPRAGGSPGRRCRGGAGASAPRAPCSSPIEKPDTRTSPWVGRWSAKMSLRMVDLPAPGVAGQEDELPLRDAEGDVLQGHRAVRVGHRNLRESNHGWKITAFPAPAPGRR